MMDSMIKTIHRDLAAGKVSCKDLVQEKMALLSANPYNSVNLLLEEAVLAQAKQVDEKIKAGHPIGLLEGIPFGISDVLLLQNSITTGSSVFLKQYVAPYTATAVQKLINAGAIPIVKEKGDSFGHGAISESTQYSKATNGDSAMNVAKGLTTFSIGGDTDGAIRQSAGSNKIYGMKPTYGRISRCGLIANASSTDCIGTLTTSLEDIRILLNTMSGKDPKDPTTYASTPIPETVFNPEFPEKEIVAGYYKSFIDNDFIDDVTKNDFQRMLDILSAKGIKIKPLDFFDVSVLTSVFYVLTMAETASNFARFDGCLYGARAISSSNKDCYKKTRAENFSANTKEWIIGGIKALSRGYDEDMYLKATQLRHAILAHLDSDFQNVNILLSPVTTTCRDAARHVSTLCLSPTFSLGGLPTLTTPAGIQITANKNREDIILHFANTLKQLL